MKKPSPLSLFTVLPWSFAAIGVIVALGNLLGLAQSEVPMVPRVDHIAGLLASSLFLFGIGLAIDLLRPVLRPQS